MENKNNSRPEGWYQWGSENSLVVVQSGGAGWLALILERKTGFRIRDLYPGKSTKGLKEIRDFLSILYLKFRRDEKVAFSPSHGGGRGVVNGFLSKPYSFWFKITSGK